MDEWTTGFGFGVFWLMPFLVALFAFQMIEWSWMPFLGLVLFGLIFGIVQLIARFSLKQWVIGVTSKEN